MQATFLSRARRMTTRDSRTVNLTRPLTSRLAGPARITLIAIIFALSGMTAIANAQSDVAGADSTDPTLGGKVISSDGMCLYASVSTWTRKANIKLAGCDEATRTTWELTEDGKLKLGDKCLASASQDGRSGMALSLADCDSQSGVVRWTADGDMISNQAAEACLQSDGRGDDDSSAPRSENGRRSSKSYEPTQSKVKLNDCDGNRLSQRWQLPKDQSKMANDSSSAFVEVSESSDGSMQATSGSGASNESQDDRKRKDSDAVATTGQGQGTPSTSKPVQSKPANPAPAPTPAAPAPAQAPAPVAAPAVSGAGSGAKVPIGDLPGWKQTFVEDFTKDAPIGSWATTDGNKVVYTGDHGGKWVTYGDGWKSTYTNGRPGYQPGQVLSVKNGNLDYYLHKVGGNASGANPSPLLAGGSQYQTYGRFSLRMKADPGLNSYYAAILLWPKSENNWQCAESDYPEGGLTGSAGGFAHYCGGGTQDEIKTGVKFTDWHTYTQEWAPGIRRYYVDGKLVGTSTKQVWANEQRWQLQIEPKGNGNDSGHVQIDWVTAYTYQR